MARGCFVVVFIRKRDSDPAKPEVCVANSDAVHFQLALCQFPGLSSGSEEKNSRGGNKVTLPLIFRNPCLRRGFLFDLSYPQGRGYKPCLWVATAAQSTIPSASGHKKTRCDSHNGQGDGGITDMAHLLSVDQPHIWCRLAPVRI